MTLQTDAAALIRTVPTRTAPTRTEAAAAKTTPPVQAPPRQPTVSRQAILPPEGIRRLSYAAGAVTGVVMAAWMLADLSARFVATKPYEVVFYEVVFTLMLAMAMGAAASGIVRGAAWVIDGFGARPHP